MAGGFVPSQFERRRSSGYAWWDPRDWMWRLWYFDWTLITDVIGIFGNLLMAAWTFATYFNSHTYAFGAPGFAVFGTLVLDAIIVIYHVQALLRGQEIDWAFLAYRLFEGTGEMLFLLGTTTKINLLFFAFTIPVLIPVLPFLAPLCFLLASGCWALDAYHKIHEGKPGATYSFAASVIMVGITVALIIAAFGLTGGLGAAVTLGVAVVASAVLWAVSEWHRRQSLPDRASDYVEATPEVQWHDRGYALHISPPGPGLAHEASPASDEPEPPPTPGSIDEGALGESAHRRPTGRGFGRQRSAGSPILLRSSRTGTPTEPSAPAKPPPHPPISRH